MIALAIRYRVALAALALIAALWIGLQLYVRDAIKDDRREATVTALEQGKRADDMAGTVAASAAAQIQQENDNARQAAARSDDPLGDGLRSLRAGARRDDQTARHQHHRSIEPCFGVE